MNFEDLKKAVFETAILKSQVAVLDAAMVGQLTTGVADEVVKILEKVKENGIS
jgi:hypothetical protein